MLMLISIFGAGLAVGLIGFPLARAIARGISDNVPAPYDGPSRKNGEFEVTRLASASGILLGSTYRRSVLERARDKHHACAPELGLDFETVLTVCRWAENRQIRYDMVIGAAGVLGLALFLSGQFVFSLGVALLMLGVTFYKRFEERFRLALSFRRGAYDASKIRQRFGARLSDEERRGLPRLDQNIWAYSGFLPFDGAGSEVGGWSFVVDATRPSKSIERRQLTSFDTNEILQAAEAAVAEIGHRGLLCRDYVVVHGSNLPNLMPASKSGVWRTVQRAERGLFDALQDGNDDRMRHYKWIQFRDWGNELIVSSFLFCSRVSDEVFIECKHFLLTALAQRYRRIDALTNSTWWTGVRWVLTRILLSPFDVVMSLLWLVYRPISALPRVLKIQDWWDRVIMADEPRYNFGAPVSLRQILAGDRYTHYFQRSDKDMLEKLIDKRILDSLIDFFEEHGVDTSDIKERQSMILNHGIIVSGGDVKAQNMAVGRGARVQSMLGRFARRRQAKVKSA